MEARWKDSLRNLEAQFVTDVVPPARVSNAQFPITAHAQGIHRFGPGELQIDELTASTRATQYSRFWHTVVRGRRLRSQ